MNGTNAPTTAKPEATFEGIIRKFEDDVNLSGQLATRSRILVEKIIGTEPQDDAKPEVATDPNTLSDKLARCAEELRVSLNEVSGWLLKLEESL